MLNQRKRWPSKKRTFGGIVKLTLHDMYVEYCIIFVGTVYLNIGLLRYRHLVLYVCKYVRFNNKYTELWRRYCRTKLHKTYLTQRCPGQRSFDLELYLWQRSVWLSFVLNSDPFCLSTVGDTAEKRKRKLSLRIHKSQISLRILNKEVRWECILQKAGARKSRETVI